MSVPDAEEQQHEQGSGQGLAGLTRQGSKSPLRSHPGTPGKIAARLNRSQPAQSDALDALRQEQARMKAEYSRMEVSIAETQQ